MTAQQVENRADARGVVKSVDGDCLVLALPHTDYQLHLVPSAEIKVEPGKRIRGTIRVSALRIHAARGGGRFIEPVIGAPRIVAGCVLAVDETARRVLVDVSVPMWVDVQAEQDLGLCRPGELVNFYVASGATFTPHEA